MLVTFYVPKQSAEAFLVSREGSLIRLSAVLLSSLLLGGRLAAQVPEQSAPEPVDSVEALGEETTHAAWRTSYFPYLTGGTNDGPVLAFRVHHFQPAEYEDRVTTNAAITGEAGITSRGSRYLSLRFKAPQLWKKWRVSALAAAGREARFGYFGIGNDT